MFELEKIVRPNILSLKPYTNARDEFSGKGRIFLDANENPYGTINRYPDPHQKKLKKKISLMKNIPVENIFLGNGSDEVIDLCIRIFCEPGKNKVLSFTPTYGMYEVSAAINDVEMINLKLNSSFQIEQNSLAPYLKDSGLKLIFICSPNNPTGNLINETAVQFILKNFKGIVIIDEAYIDFTYQDSWMNRLTDFPNLIVTQTFSKAWGMAGARVGMAFADVKIISYFNKVKAPYNISALNQQKILSRLENQEEVNKIRKMLINEKNQLIQKFSEMDQIKKVYPSDANFILIELKDANHTYQQLLDKQIIVRNRNGIIKNCLRITVGKPSENKKMINELKKILK